MVTRKTIDDFFAIKRMAMIGVSRDKNSYSRRLMADMQAKGYEVLAVNPNTESVDGQKCYKSVADISPLPEAAIMLLPPDKTEAAMAECAKAGVKKVWMHNHIMAGVQNTRAIYEAEKGGISLITGFCPFMFLPGTAFFHKMHGAVIKLFGQYPK